MPTDIVVNGNLVIPKSNKISKPVLNPSSFQYTGSTITPQFNEKDDRLTFSGDLFAKEVGDYTITVSIENKSVFKWADGTTGNITYTWHITKQTVNLEIPHLEISEFDYDGSEHTPKIIDFDSSKMTKAGDLSAVRANFEGTSYKIYISLKQDENYIYQWIDSNGNTFTDDIILEWHINHITIPKPVLDCYEYNYTGSAAVSSSNYKLPAITISGFDKKTIENIIDISGIGLEKQYKAGTYSIVFSLKDPDSSAWDNGNGTISMDSVVLTWKINTITVAPPSMETSEYTYTGNSITPDVSGYDKNIMDRSGVTSKTNAGEYSITYSLYDTDSCSWNNGTTDPVTLDWKINKQIMFLDVPYLDPEYFNYDGYKKEPEIVNYKSLYMEYKENRSAIDVGTWLIIIHLKSNDNYVYRWEGEESDEVNSEDLELEWRINQGTFDLPKITSETDEFDYDGTVKKVTASEYSNRAVTRSGTLSATKAGEYEIRYSINNTGFAKWADGSTEDKFVYWRINKSVFPIPTAQNTSLECLPKSVSYNANCSKQTLEVNGYNSNVMEVSGNSASVPGLYTASFTLKDVDSASWEDGTIDDKTIEWQITKKQHFVTKPTLVNNIFLYTGTAHTIQLNNSNDDVILVSGETNGTAARDYQAKAELRQSNIFDFKWDDNSVEDLFFDWIIEKAPFKKPALTDNSFDYNGLTQTVTVDNFNSNVMEYKNGSTLSAKPTGDYFIVVKLKDKNSSYWENDSDDTDDILLTWNINPIKVQVPSVSGTEKTYTGSKQGPAISEYDSNVISCEGVYSTINAGEYEFYFELTDPNSSCWADDTTEIKIFKWVINKAEFSKTFTVPYLSKTEFVYTGKTVKFLTEEPSEFLERYVYAYIKNTDKSYETISGDTYKITKGEYTITVSLKDDKNHILRWDDGTTEPIELTWEITPAVFEIPALSKDVFFYSGKTPSPFNTYGYHAPLIKNYDYWAMAAKGMSMGYKTPDGSFVDTVDRDNFSAGKYYGTSRWNVEKYYVKINLKHPDSAQWSDGSNGGVTLEWAIVREIILLEKPYLTASSYEYDGTEKEPDITNEAAGIVFSGTRKATEVGNYSITAKLYRKFEYTDLYDYRWSDNTIDDIVVMNWNIWSDGLLAAPDAAPLSFEYDGTEKQPVIYGFDENIMEKSGIFSATETGTYTITFSLKNPGSTSWANGSTDSKTFTWVITKSVAYLPNLAPDDLMYDECPHSVTTEEDSTGNSFVLYNYNPDKMGYNGDTSALEVKTYQLNVFLKDTKSCTWSDGTTNNISINYTISKKIVLLDIPELNPNEFIYDGTEKTPNILPPNVSTWIDKGIVKGGDISATDAGNYTMILSLAEDENITYLWSDHSDTPLNLPWKIKGRTGGDEGGNGIEKPVVGSLHFVYDGNEHGPIILEFEENFVDITGTLKAVNAGEYVITFSLNNKESCTWEDGTTADYVVSWTIEKSKTKKPFVSQNEFNYDGIEHSPILQNLDENAVIKTGNIKETAAGEYDVEIIPDENHTWLDGTSDTIDFAWKINKSVFNVPVVSDLNFVYDGQAYAPAVNGFNGDVMSISGNSPLTDAGEYTLVISLKDVNSASWNDNTTDPKTFNWRIDKKFIEEPYLLQDEFDYSGGIHKPVIKNVDTQYMLVSGEQQGIIAGNYNIIISFIDSKNCQWKNNNNSDPLSLPWVIHGTPVGRPSLDNTAFVYDGLEHAPNIIDFSSVSMTKTGIESAENVGIYTITFSLREGYEWSDGGFDPIPLIWEITKIFVKKPMVTDTEFTYDKNPHRPKVSSYDINTIKIRGDSKATDAGDYTLIFFLKDKEHVAWEDDRTSEDYIVNWFIEKVTVPIPVGITVDFVYNGGINIPVIDNVNDAVYMGAEFDEALRSKSYTIYYYGTKKAINAGNYNLRFGLVDVNNYIWEDDTTANIIIPWTIEPKAISKPYLDPEIFEYNGKVRKPTVVGFVSGAMRYYEDVEGDPVFSASKIGNYRITVLLGKKVVDTLGNTYIVYNYKWDDGDEENPYKVVLRWQIQAGKLPYPYLIEDTYVYTGKNITPAVYGYDSRTMTIIGDTPAINAGEHGIGFTLIDPENFEWAEGVTDGEILPWWIQRAKLSKTLNLPYYDTNLVYNGKEQSPVWKNYNSEKLKIIGEDEEAKTDAGSYETEFVPTDNYIWDDGTLDPVAVSWEIEKLGIMAPKQKNTLYYNGEEQTPEWSTTYNLDNITYEGDTFGISAKEYYVTCICDSNCYFLDTGNDSCCSYWSIQKQKLSVPYPEKEYEFTGSEITPVFVKYDPDILAMTDNSKTSGTEPGEYTVYFKIIDEDNYEWKEKYQQ